LIFFKKNKNGLTTTTWHGGRGTAAVDVYFSKKFLVRLFIFRKSKEKKKLPFAVTQND
jgi:hypothetical protein